MLASSRIVSSFHRICSTRNQRRCHKRDVRGPRSVPSSVLNQPEFAIEKPCSQLMGASFRPAGGSSARAGARALPPIYEQGAMQHALSYEGELSVMPGGTRLLGKLRLRLSQPGAIIGWSSNDADGTVFPNSGATSPKQSHAWLILRASCDWKPRIMAQSGAIPKHRRVLALRRARHRAAEHHGCASPSLPNA